MMIDRVGREFLHTPGPTNIPDRVLAAMHRQAIDLADPRLKDLASSVFEDMKKVFRTSGRVFIYAANGHGGWEAGLTNVCAPGDAVLVPEVGHFSNSWADHARALGLKVDVIASDWRRAIEPDQIEARLRQDTDKRIKAVLAVHVDTATGVAADIPAIRAAIDAAGHPALLVVDTIASLAAARFEMDAWGVDVTITASQKALMCPPGLAIVAANERAVEISAKLPRHQRYWDWGARTGDEYYLKFNGTMPEHHMFGLREALNIIEENGLEAIFRRHDRLAGAVQRAVEVWSEGGALGFNAVVPEQRSVSVTTIRTADGVNGDLVRSYARDKLGVALGGGLGALAGKAFRIGHMGDINEGMVLGCLSTVELALVELGIPHGKNAVRAAVEFLARERASGGAAEEQRAAA